MLLRQMKYYKAVVDHKNFYDAAEACNISQSAISQQIKALEDELGVLLLRRHNRTFSLTEAGELFYRKSTIILSDVNVLLSDIRRQVQHKDESLRIGYPVNFADEQIINSVSVFKKRYPDAVLELESGNHERLYELLKTGKVDIVINDQRRAFSDDYLNIELTAFPLSVEISMYHPYATLDVVEIEDLKNFPCILIADKSQEDTEFTYYHDIIGFVGDFVFARNLNEARLMVTSGKGIMPVEGRVTVPNISSTVKRLSLLKNGQIINRKYCAFSKKSPTGYNVLEFIEELKKQFQNQ